MNARERSLFNSHPLLSVAHARTAAAHARAEPLRNINRFSEEEIEQACLEILEHVNPDEPAPVYVLRNGWPAHRFALALMFRK